MIGKNFTYNGFDYDETLITGNNFIHVSSVSYYQLSPRQRRINKSNFHGEYLGPMFTGNRQIVIQGEIIAEDRVARGVLLEQLQNTFAIPGFPSLQNRGFEPFTLERDVDGKVLNIDAMVTRPLDITDEIGNIHTSTRWRVELKCDGFAFRGDEVEYFGTEGLTSGFFLPTFLPTGLNLENPTVSWVDDSTIEAPLFITITGPSLNPKVVHVQSLRTFRVLRNMTLPTESITIDTATGDVRDQDGNVINGQIETGSQFLYSQNGQNDISFSDDSPIDGINDASISVKFEPRYM